MKETIAWWRPELGSSETQRVLDVLTSNYINDGEVTAEFERRIAELVGAKFGVAVTSGTAAIYLSLVALGVGHGDEVIVPDITFIATANAVSMAGATPVPVDVDPVTLCLNAALLETSFTPRTKAIIPVHVSGRPCDMPKILQAAQARQIPVVEDAAEALGSHYRGRALGTFGNTGCFSFSPNKTITTGQGGMIVTNDETIFRRLRALKDQGRSAPGTGGNDAHPAIGFNFKLTNLQAAVGLGQLEKLEARRDRIRRTYSIYRNELASTEGIRVLSFDLEQGEQPQWADALATRRDELDAFLRQNKVDCRRFWFPLHQQPAYRRPDTDFPVSTQLGPSAIWLPSAFQMTDQSALQVCGLIRKFYRT